jgi:hypothetical protein
VLHGTPAGSLRIAAAPRRIERMSETDRPAMFGDTPIPADLIRLKADAVEAHLRAGELVAAGPTGSDIIAGRAQISAEQAEQVEALRERERAAAEAIELHSWRATLPPSQWLNARQALLAAATTVIEARSPDLLARTHQQDG